MASSVIMPKAGMAMEEGVIVSWLKKEGDAVKRGEPIAEIETDKVVMELEAEADGVVIAIVRGAGDRVPVTEIIAWIGAPGETPPKTAPAAASLEKSAAAGETPAGASAPLASGSSRVPATPAARQLASEAGMDLRALPLPPSGAFHAEDVRRHIRKDATPLASRMAEAAAFDLASVPRPEGGRARKADVVAAASRRADAAGGNPEAQDRRLPFTPIQRISGERLSRSHAEIPAVTLFATADATRLLELREEFNERGTARISINDLALKACAIALRANPKANAVVDGDGLLLKGAVNIGLAVATDAGLIVPTIRDVDRLTIEELARRTKDLAERARARRLRAEELEGGTFTVSNIGMYGVTAFTPIINQPQVGILGIGAIEDRLTLREGAPALRKFLHLSFTFDHRAMDGAESSAFVQDVKELVERPLRIVL